MTTDISESPVDTSVPRPSQKDHPINPKNYELNKKARDFPGGAVVRNPPPNAGDTGSSPGPGKSHMPQSN